MGTARLMLPFRAPSPGYFLENSLMISRQVPDQVWVHTVESLSRNLEYIEEGGLGANSLSLIQHFSMNPLNLWSKMMAAV